MVKEQQGDLVAEVIRSATRAASQMIKASEKKAKAEVIHRPKINEQLAEIQAGVTTNIRHNVNALMAIEADYEDGMTPRQLGIAMGWKSCIIYGSLKEGAEKNIGLTTMCRYSMVLGIPVHVLTMPHSLFKKAFLDEYKIRRARGEVTLGRSGKR